jgi:hypothetical protein
MPRLAARSFGGGVALPVAGAPGVTFATTPGANSITFETWLKITPALIAGTHAIATFENPAYSTGFLISQNGNDLVLYKPNGGGGPAVTYSNALANYLGKWIHFAVIFTINGAASTAQAFINGVGLGAQGALAAWNLASGTLGLGGSVDGFNAPAGNFAGTRFYLRALSAQDVADRYYLNRDDAAMRTSLLAQWDFAEQGGTTTVDLSGNNNTGTLVGGTTWTTDVPMKTRGAAAQSQNLLRWSEDFSNGVWSPQTGVTVVANSPDVPDPNGGSTASKVAYDGSGAVGSFRIFQSIAGIGVPGSSYTASVWLRTLSGTATIRLSNNNDVSTIVVTSTWQRFSLTTKSWPNFAALQLLLYSPAADNTPFTVYGWGAQIAEANWSGPYARTTASAVNTGAIRSPPAVQQNFFTWSSDLTNAAWIVVDQPLTKTGGQSDPLGGTAACQIADSAHTGSFRFSQNLSVNPAAGIVTVGVYAKQGTKNWFSIGDSSTGRSAWYNLATGVVGTANTGATASMQAVGGGWYLCLITYRNISITPSMMFFICPGDGTISYTGDGTGTIFLAYPQLVQANWYGPLASTQGSIVNTGAIRSMAVSRSAVT